MSADAPTIRHAARVIVLDERDRVLLFRTVHPNTGTVVWFTPGGGLEPGEDARAAAERELGEETGLRGVTLGPELWHRRHVFRWREAHLDQRERFFLLRVPCFAVDLSGATEEERTVLTESRWWTVDELEATTDRLGPSQLPSLLAHLIADGPPPTPRSIGP